MAESRNLFNLTCTPKKGCNTGSYGVKQPNIFLIIFLIALAILPGVIAVFVLTKNYLIGLTNKRFLVLRIKSQGNPEVREIKEYRLHEIGRMKVKFSTSTLFTKIRIDDSERPFNAKFHCAFSKSNRPNTMTIDEAIAADAVN